MNYGPLIARKLQQNPGYVDEALLTLKRWNALGNMPERRAKEWHAILMNAKRSKAGFRELLRIFRSRKEEDQRLRDFAPFAGVLSREERRKVFLKCIYDH